jgi:hypothetical protein
MMGSLGWANCEFTTHYTLARLQAHRENYGIRLRIFIVGYVLLRSRSSPDHNHIQPDDREGDQEGDKKDQRCADQVRRDHDLLAVVAIDEHARDQADE